MSDLPPLKDLDDVFADRLELPIGGTVYVFNGPDAQVGLYCQRLVAVGVQVSLGNEIVGEAPPLELDDDDEWALYRRIMGPTLQQMIDDGISFPKIKFVGETVIFWLGGGPELAYSYWNSGGPSAMGKARPSRPERRATAKAAPKKVAPRKKAGNNTAVASTTQKRASTSGTKSRKPN